MRISWRNLFWKLLTFLISEIDAFSLRNDRQTTTAPGDLILYQGNSFVIYYDTNSWNFTRLGKVDGVSSRNEMLDLLGGKGEVTVTLSLAE